MAIFDVRRVDGSGGMIVRTPGISCARRMAVDNAGEEGTRVWRDPEQSTVRLAVNPKYPTAGRNCLLEKYR